MQGIPPPITTTPAPPRPPGSPPRCLILLRTVQSRRPRAGRGRGSPGKGPRYPGTEPGGGKAAGRKRGEARRGRGRWRGTEGLVSVLSTHPPLSSVICPVGESGERTAAPGTPGLGCRRAAPAAGAAPTPLTTGVSTAYRPPQKFPPWKRGSESNRLSPGARTAAPELRGGGCCRPIPEPLRTFSPRRGLEKDLSNPPPSPSTPETLPRLPTLPRGRVWGGPPSAPRRYKTHPRRRGGGGPPLVPWYGEAPPPDNLQRQK